MVFNLFRQSKGLQPKSPIDEYQGDSLDQKMTEIAIDLINGNQGPEFRGYFIGIFRNEPRFIKNVAPEHREALQQVLSRGK